MRTLTATSLIALVGLAAACATPGIDYEARLMPASADAAATRTVQVDRFRGPGGRWYTERFEAMLANTTFDGAPWFQLADFRYGGPGDERSGTYTGDIDIVSYTVNERYRTVSKCVEWDGLFDCETRADVEELCIDERVEVAVTPRLIDSETGYVIFTGTYGGTSGGEVCSELDHHHDGRRGLRAGNLFGVPGVSPPPDMVFSALSETLGPIRRDIAPRNATVRATFITEAMDPVVRADPRFEQAVKMAAKDPYGSCNMWTVMSEVYPQAPAVVHNMGACAEASTDFAAAQALYAEAAELSAKYSGEDNKGARQILKSLRKISDQRYGEELINELSGVSDEPQPEAES